MNAGTEKINPIPQLIIPIMPKIIPAIALPEAGMPMDFSSLFAPAPLAMATMPKISPQQNSPIIPQIKEVRALFSALSTAKLPYGLLYGLF